MKKLIIIYLLFLFSSQLSSCQTTKVFYYDILGSGVCGGEIRAYALFRFFEPSEDDIKVFHIKSNKLSSQLKKIKNQITKKGFVVGETDSSIWDDRWYNYAFITANNDTLYSLYLFNRWRYKNMVMDFNIVELDLHLPGIADDDGWEQNLCVENLKTNQTKRIMTSQEQVMQILNAIHSGEPDNRSFEQDYKISFYCDEYVPGTDVLFDTSTSKKDVLYQKWGVEITYKMEKKWRRKIRKYLK